MRRQAPQARDHVVMHDHDAEGGVAGDDRPEAGLDAAIADPLDRKLMANILSADVLLGRDKYGMNYTRAFRAGKLG